MERLILYPIAGLLKAAGFALRVVPVKRRVAFLSRQGSSASIDFALLEDQLKSDDPQLQTVMCLCEPETKGVLKFVGNTARQLVLAQTSQVVVLDGYIPAVSVPAPRPGVTVVQMWHALAAVKKFGYQCLDTPHGRSSASARILRMHRNYDYVVAGGPWAVEPLSKAFDCDPDIVKPLGLPRLDYITAESFRAHRDQKRNDLLARYPQLGNGKPVVVYAPTFRRGESAFAMRQVLAHAQQLKELDCNVVVSGHPLDDDHNGDALPGNVIAVSGVRTIDLLPLADALITDYSAIAYEAMAAGVPVYYFFPDAREYRESPGLNLDPQEAYPDRCAPTLPMVIALSLGNESMLSKPQGDYTVPNDCTRAVANLIEVNLS